MFRVGVICAGLTEEEGAAAVPEILWEFHNRPRHLNPQCTWGSTVLALVVENPFDSTGAEVLEDFKEAVYARVQYSSGMLRFLIESVTEFIPQRWLGVRERAHMAIDEKSFLVAEQRRLESNQPGSTWFYLRHPKVTVFWLLVLIGFAAFIAFKN